MPAPYSLDLRKKIVENLEEGKETISSVAKWFRVSYDFVSSLWKKYQETGNIAPKKIGGYTKPKVNKAGEEQLRIWLQKEPSLTLDELCKKYEQQFQIKIGKSSIDRALKRAEITVKKKSTYDPAKYTEKNQRLTVEYNRQIKTIPVKDIIFIDEMGVNLNQTLDYGRAPKGKRAYDEKPTKKGERISLAGALSVSGMKAAFNFQGTMTGEVFLFFLKNFLCPKLKPRNYVVMDNARVHKVEGVKELIESTGAKIIYLPPYSPELNAIELSWNKIKRCLKKQKARTVESLYQAYGKALNSISKTDSKRFVKHAMSFVI